MVKSRLAVIEDVVKFLKENRQGSVPLNIIDAEYLIQQAHRAEHNARDLDILDRELARTQTQVERYKQALERVRSLSSNEGADVVIFSFVDGVLMKGAEPNDDQS